MTSRALAFRRLVAGELSSADQRELTERVARSSAYGWPETLGAARQYAAILADRTRYRLLSRIRAPTLVVHGARDRLLPAPHGVNLAVRIKGARFVLEPAMAHEISCSGGARLAERILGHIANADPRRA